MEVAARLIDVVQYAPGSDPLGRTIHHLDAADDPLPGPLPEQPHRLVSFLQDDVSTSIYGSLPQCDAERDEVIGQPALYIETRGWSTVPLDKFDMLVDPINWPKCPLQATYFKSMVPDGTPDQPLPFPEKQGSPARQITTMKSVCFSDPNMNLPASFICPVWSLASAMLSHACLDNS